MNNKPLKKVCTKCLDANKQLQLNADFFVEVQYGVCDCCGDRGVVIPFERFFSSNTKLTPHNSTPAVPTASAGEEGLYPVVQLLKENTEKSFAEVNKLSVENMEQIEALNKEREEHLKLIRELQDRIGHWEAITQREVSTEPQAPATSQKPKQGKNGKVGEESAYE